MKIIFLFLSVLLSSFNVDASSICTIDSQERDDRSSLIYSIFLDGEQFTDRIFLF